MATNTTKLDREIIAIVEARQPVSMKQIMRHMETDHNRAGHSMRPTAERVYHLKREGKLAMVGVGRDSQYSLPSYNPVTKATEAQRQAAEGQKRESTASPSAPVVVVEEQDPNSIYPAGWSTLREQLDRGEDLAEPSATPLVTTTLPIVQRAPLSLSISALAGDVAAQVAMTVERVIGHDIKRYEDVIADLQTQLAEREAEIVRMVAELKAAEQLGNEAEEKYSTLRAKLREL